MIGVLRCIRDSFGKTVRGGCLTLVAIGILLAQPAVSSAATNERYAAYVIDVSNGNVLFSRSADAKRYPASLTKIMTMYLMFEDLDAGRIRLDTKLKASQNAANQAPSKLGLRAGHTITVEQAILALVTKSANDVAVVVAENLGGSVSKFADRMTRTAKAIGMRNTRFRNPHGLPNSGQITTAHDMAILGIQTMRRFPKFYAYYQTRSFKWKGATYGNHNKLLGRVAGVDGIKTGYIRASGFNLVASMRRNGRHIVAVVMGGRTGSSRDAHMRDLLEKNIKLASSGGTMMFAHAPMPPTRPDDASLLVTTSSAQSIPVPRLVVPSTTVPGTLVTAGLGSNSLLSGDIATGSVAALIAATQPTEAGSAEDVTPVQKVAVPSPAPVPSRAPANTGKWKIQVGAFNSKKLALDMLQRAKSRAPTLLASATPFTETTSKNGETLWRARFAGFDQGSASGACAKLKRQSFGCFPTRN